VLTDLLGLLFGRVGPFFAHAYPPIARLYYLEGKAVERGLGGGCVERLTMCRTTGPPKKVDDVETELVEDREGSISKKTLYSVFLS